MHADLGLGKVITKPQKRDAIHIAVAPLVAAHGMTPGMHIGLNEKGEASNHVKAFLGIVDPYLDKAVKTGDTFWMFLYPNTVTGLRHDWSHPDFVNDVQTMAPDLVYSEQWLRKYAARVKPYEKPDEAYKNLLSELRSGELFYHGIDMHSRGDVIDEEELKEHGEAVLGISLDFSRFSFSCSC